MMVLTTNDIIETNGLVLATWNVERLKHKGKLQNIIENCHNAMADILVLTEDDSVIKLKYKNCFRSTSLSDEDIKYKNTENRVTIYTDYDCIEEHKTFDSKTALCVGEREKKVSTFFMDFTKKSERNPLWISL
jgi:hypothetical protein